MVTHPGLQCPQGDAVQPITFTESFESGENSIERRQAGNKEGLVANNLEAVLLTFRMLYWAGLKARGRVRVAGHGGPPAPQAEQNS